MTAVEELFVDVTGGRIFTLQWGEGPLLLFGHATGMCARLYLDLLGPLAGRFRVVAFDARGHGRTELAAVPGEVPADWKPYRADLRNLVTALGGGPVRLAGHSFGATVAFETAVETPGFADSVVMLDPPWIPFAHADAYRAVRDSGPPPPNPMADQAARRRGHFHSRATARAAYHHRGVFKAWPDAALDAYLEGGLLLDETGVRLACTPAWEATSFRGVSTTMEASMRACRLPFTMLCAADGSTVSADDEAMIAALHPGAVIRRFSGTGHFLPVTHPDLVRPYLLAMV
jgi:pimeloyl-ACP methyl ester carboxylesterase